MRLRTCKGSIIMSKVLTLFTAFCFTVFTHNAFGADQSNSLTDVTHDDVNLSPAPSPMKVKIIILNPKGREIPEHANKSLREIASFTGDFLAKGMKKQGYPAQNTDIFELDENGSVKIYVANSPLDMFELESIHNKKKHAYQHINGEKPPFDNTVWWVFSNISNKVKYGFSGGGNVILGTSIANLPQTYQKIKPGMSLGSSGYFTENKMKAIVHELGHALQLPHNGPIPVSLGKDPDGNTLMGPVIKLFKKRYDANESKVYLSKLSAAMLWKHPVFNMTQYQPHESSDFEISDVVMTHDANDNLATVSGKINTSLAFHSVVGIDVPANSKRRKMQRINPGYQDRGYVAILDSNGRFEFTLDKMTASKGTFILLACFDNGLLTAKLNSQKDLKKNWKSINYNFID